MVKPTKPISSFFGPCVIDLSSDSDDTPILSASILLPMVKPATKLPAMQTASKRSATQLPANVPAKLLEEHIPPNAAELVATCSYDSDAGNSQQLHQ